MGQRCFPETSVTTNLHCVTSQKNEDLFLVFSILARGPGSSVGIATDYGMDGPGSNPATCCAASQSLGAEVAKGKSVCANSSLV